MPEARRQTSVFTWYLGFRLRSLDLRIWALSLDFGLYLFQSLTTKDQSPKSKTQVNMDFGLSNLVFRLRSSFGLWTLASELGCTCTLWVRIWSQTILLHCRKYIQHSYGISPRLQDELFIQFYKNNSVGWKF